MVPRTTKVGRRNARPKDLGLGVRKGPPAENTMVVAIAGGTQTAHGQGGVTKVYQDVIAQCRGSGTSANHLSKDRIAVGENIHGKRGAVHGLNELLSFLSGFDCHNGQDWSKDLFCQQTTVTWWIDNNGGMDELILDVAQGRATHHNLAVSSCFLNLFDKLHLTSRVAFLDHATQLRRFHIGTKLLLHGPNQFLHQSILVILMHNEIIGTDARLPGIPCFPPHNALGCQME
mmetsp:Transcript_21323/g.35260  ORF Transcript_21323/g.35260 Transcript_21323/m.35260 type:complete len:231 (+) Transcript_21323:117-809(+)